ncbi:MAG: hypothetical protein HY721_09855 [Planctomycetes bacterium]|nr:hypothetical protein [Planctomycetota bacterium]
MSLENKLDFAEKLLPELLGRLERGERGPDLEGWLDGRLKRYGADGRLLVAAAVHAFLEAEASRISRDAAEWLRAAFVRRR